jgi:hypothetical protein
MVEADGRGGLATGGFEDAAEAMAEADRIVAAHLDEATSSRSTHRSWPCATLPRWSGRGWSAPPFRRSRSSAGFGGTEPTVIARERRSSKAAAMAAFDRLQRETSLELQQALADLYTAADRAAYYRTRSLAGHDGAPTQADEERWITFQTQAHKVNVLVCRLADPNIQTAVTNALELVTRLARARTTEEHRTSVDPALHANNGAIRRLGELVRQPPGA